MTAWPVHRLKIEPEEVNSLFAPFNYNAVLLLPAIAFAGLS